MKSFAGMFAAATLTLTLTACATGSPQPDTAPPATTPGAQTTPISVDELTITKGTVFMADTMMEIRDTYKAANIVDQYKICDQFTPVVEALTAKESVDIMAALSSQQLGAGDAFQDQRWDCNNLGSSDKVIAVGDGDSGDWRPVGEYALDELFSPAVAEIRAEFDASSDADRLKICNGVAGTVEGIEGRDMESRAGDMTAYDRDVLQNLVSQCISIIRRN